MGEFFELIPNLNGKLARRDEDQGPRPDAPALRRQRHPLENREDERTRLAGSGAGLPENVDPLQGPRDETRLNGSGDGIAGAIDGRERGRSEAEFREVTRNGCGLRGDRIDPVGIGGSRASAALGSPLFGRPIPGTPVVTGPAAGFQSHS